jgi:hypothetical protein
MERPHLLAAWLALLALVLTATGAPLPFPRKSPHPALKVVQGEWAMYILSMEGLGPRTERIPRLSVSVQGDRLVLRHDGELAFEWTVSPAPSHSEGGVAVRLTPRAGG